MQIVQICEKLEKYLAGHATAQERIAAGAEALSRIFGVQKGEIAVFLLDPVEETFSFVWPPELKKVGTVPANADRSLVAVTARERKGILDNSFASTPHFFVFEKSAHIEKIMSAPILKGEELVGVVQVCRKASPTGEELKNFTRPELDALCALAKVMARYLAD